MSGPPTGRHLGRKLADILAETHSKVRANALPGETEYRARYHKAFMEQVEDDLAPTFREVFAGVLEHPDCPDEARAFFGPLLRPEHQGQFFLTIISLLGLGIAGPGAAARGWLQRLENASLQAHGDLKLSPAEAATGVVKGAITNDVALAYASTAGMRDGPFSHLVDLTGDPPGPEELLQAYRRGIIDEGRLEHGIRQGRIKNEWVDVVRALRFAPPGAGQVIAAAVEGHLSEGEARHRLGEAGIDPGNYPWLYETAGRPPGTMEMIELWRRGDATEAQVREAVRESDVKNKYIDAIVKLRRHVPPPRSVVAMLRHGSIDDALARTMLAAGGVEGPDADVMIRDGHHQATTAMRQLAAGEVVTAYTDGIIDRAGALSHLHAIHYDDADADVMLAIADMRRERRYAEAAIGRIRTTYVGHHIARNEASTALDGLGVPPDQRGHLIHLWDLERGANVKMLTEAQVAKAAKQRLIDDAEFKRRLVALGYTDADADLLVRLQNPAPTTGGLGP